MTTESTQTGPTVEALARAYIAANDCRACVVGKMMFWAEQFPERSILSITPDDVDAALGVLQQRGKLRPVRNRPPERTGKPLSGATLNRYLATLGTLHRWARRNRMIPRHAISPTRGIEREREHVDPDRYLRAEQVEKLIAVARVADTSWKRLAAFIQVGFQTGLRKSNILALRWKDVDLAARRITVLRTKNGKPTVVPLTAATISALELVPGRRDAEALVFGNKLGQPFHVDALWKKTVRIAGMPHVTPHFLRHGTGSALARAGCNQAQIMSESSGRWSATREGEGRAGRTDRRGPVDDHAAHR